MMAAQFKAASERVQVEIRATEAEIGRRSAGSSVGRVADVADPVRAFRAIESIDRSSANGSPRR
jgi:hypothetical protein